MMSAGGVVSMGLVGRDIGRPGAMRRRMIMQLHPQHQTLVRLAGAMRDLGQRAPQGQQHGQQHKQQEAEGSHGKKITTHVILVAWKGTRRAATTGAFASCLILLKQARWLLQWWTRALG